MGQTNVALSSSRIVVMILFTAFPLNLAGDKLLVIILTTNLGCYSCGIKAWIASHCEAQITQGLVGDA